MPNAIYLRKSRSEEGVDTAQVLSKHRDALIELSNKKGIIITDIYVKSPLLR